MLNLIVLQKQLRLTTGNIREKLCLPHHDALVRVAALFVSYGGGYAEITWRQDYLVTLSLKHFQKQIGHTKHM